MQSRALSEPIVLAPPIPVLPPRGDVRSTDGDLSAGQRRAVVMGIVVLHLLGLWGLLQVQAVRDTAVQMAPILVDLLAPPAPPEPAPPQPPPARPQPTPKPRALPPTQPPVLATQAAPTPQSFSVPQPETAPAAPAPALSAAPAVATPAAPAAQAPAPQLLPDAAVQYLEPPQVEYPRLSQRRGETGMVIVRAYVGTAGGTPHSVQVERSSGHPRLDQSALSAVQKARFRPYAEAGRAVEGWALIPIRFELEK